MTTNVKKMAMSFKFSFLYSCFLCAVLFLGMHKAFSQAPYPGKELPGKAQLLKKADKIVLQNKLITFSILLEQHKVTGIEVVDVTNAKTFLFTADKALQFISTTGGTTNLSNLRIDSLSTVTNERGKEVRFSLSNGALGQSVKWITVLQNDQNFVRQFFEVNSQYEIEEIVALSIPSEMAPIVMGEIDGSPIITGNLFWAIENPLFTVDKNDGFALSIIPYDLGYGVNVSHLYRETIAIGAFPNEQLRRAFAYYLDEVRVRPYQPITFYDSWYDLSFDLNLLTEADCIERVKTWGDSLSKRSIHLDYFLWDSGWDDWNNMWNFNPELPNGFKSIKK